MTRCVPRPALRPLAAKFLERGDKGCNVAKGLFQSSPNTARAREPVVAAPVFDDVENEEANEPNGEGYGNPEQDLLVFLKQSS